MIVEIKTFEDKETVLVTRGRKPTKEELDRDTTCTVMQEVITIDFPTNTKCEMIYSVYKL